MFITMPTCGVSGRMCSSGRMITRPAGGAHQSMWPFASEISLAVTPNHRPTSSSVSPFWIWYVMSLPMMSSLAARKRIGGERTILEFVLVPRAVRGRNGAQRNQHHGGQ